jgi:hypothetical protein
VLRGDAFEKQSVVPRPLGAFNAGTGLRHKRCILFRERSIGKLQEDVALDPFPQMANRQQNPFVPAAVRIAFLPASGQRFLLLLRLQLRQEKRMAQADFVFGEGFDRRGRKLGQAKARCHIPGAFAAFGRNEFDGICRLVKAQKRSEALSLVERMHVATLEVFDLSLVLQKVSMTYTTMGYRTSWNLYL